MINQRCIVLQWNPAALRLFIKLTFFFLSELFSRTMHRMTSWCLVLEKNQIKLNQIKNKTSSERNDHDYDHAINSLSSLQITHVLSESSSAKAQQRVCFTSLKIFPETKTFWKSGCAKWASTANKGLNGGAGTGQKCSIVDTHWTQPNWKTNQLQHSEKQDECCFTHKKDQDWKHYLQRQVIESKWKCIILRY